MLFSGYLHPSNIPNLFSLSHSLSFFLFLSISQNNQLQTIATWFRCANRLDSTQPSRQRQQQQKDKIVISKTHRREIINNSVTSSSEISHSYLNSTNKSFSSLIPPPPPPVRKKKDCYNLISKYR